MLCCAIFAVTVLFVSITTPELVAEARIPPPEPAVFPATRLLVITTLVLSEYDKAYIPPPLPASLLLTMMLFLILIMALALDAWALIPPPIFCVMVLFAIVIGESERGRAAIPPPILAELLKMVLPMTAIAPEPKI